VAWICKPKIYHITWGLKHKSSTFPNRTERVEGLPQSREGNSDAEEVDGAPCHPHHESHHHQVLERRLRDFPSFLFTSGSTTQLDSNSKA
jgi:hypothetical protein